MEWTLTILIIFMINGWSALKMNKIDWFEVAFIIFYIFKNLEDLR